MQAKIYGFKNLLKLGVKIIIFKITIGRTVSNFSFKTSFFTKERKNETGERETEKEEKQKENTQEK